MTIKDVGQNRELAKCSLKIINYCHCFQSEKQLKMLDSDFGSDSQKPKYFLGRHKFTLACFQTKLNITKLGIILSC